MHYVRILVLNCFCCIMLANEIKIKNMEKKKVCVCVCACVCLCLG